MLNIHVQCRACKRRHRDKQLPKKFFPSLLFCQHQDSASTVFITRLLVQKKVLKNQNFKSLATSPPSPAGYAHICHWLNAVYCYSMVWVLVQNCLEHFLWSRSKEITGLSFSYHSSRKYFSHRNKLKVKCLCDNWL